MKNKDSADIYFLEKTSYSDTGSKHPGSWLFALLSLVSFIGIQICALYLFFGGLGLTPTGALPVLLLIAACLLFWFFQWKFPRFYPAVLLIALILLLIYAVAFISDVYQGFSLLLTQYRTLLNLSADEIAVQDLEQVQLPVAIYIVIAGICCLYGALVYRKGRNAFCVTIPGIIGAAAVFACGQVPNPRMCLLFVISGLLFLASSNALSSFGEEGTLGASGNYFYIRREEPAASDISAKIWFWAAGALVISIAGSFLITGIAGLPSTETLAGLQAQARAWADENLSFLYAPGSTKTGTKGNLCEGDLASAGDMYYYGYEQIRITVESLPEETLYIRGYVGDSYADSQWILTDSVNYDAFAALYNEDEIAGILDAGYELLSDLGTEEITIQKLASYGNYLFVPYAAGVSSYSSWVNDLYISSSLNKASFSYVSGFYSLIYDYDTLSLYGTKYFTANVSLSDVSSSYTLFVQDQYTQVPDETRTVLETFIAQAGYDPDEIPDTLSARISYVRRLLSENCTYSLTPGELPEDTDFTEYFLLENQEGYCIHFATAAVLLLRNMGVPARYVEGYLFAPENFTENDGTYEAVAYDYQAHAWVEIYLENVGWLPVEVTPTFYDSSLLTDEMEETEAAGVLPETQTEDTEEILEEESESETAQESSEESLQDTLAEEGNDTGSEEETDAAIENAEAASGESDTDSDAADHEEGGTSQGSVDGTTQGTSQDASEGVSQISGGTSDSGSITSIGKALSLILKAAGCLLLAAAAAVLILYLRYVSRNRKRLQSMRQKDTGQAVLAVYTHLLALLSASGFALQEGDDLRIYFQDLAGRLDFVDASACSEFLDTVNQAAFGRGDVSLEQLGLCRDVYRTIREGIYKQQSFGRRIYMKYLCCV